MEVDPDKLRSASPKFASTSDAVQSAFDKLNGVLQAEGKCWGDDESGQKFAEQYEPASQSAVEAFPALAKAITDIRTELDETAKTWDTDDETNANRFR